MSPVTTIVVFGLFSFVVYKKILNIFRRRKYSAEAERLGCRDPPTLPNKGFLGLGRLAEISKANKKGRHPQWFVEKFDEMGRNIHTFRGSALDYEVLITRDPENCKAIYSTHAKDFEISPHRKSAWSPLLGDGLFTAQGEAWKHSRQLLRPHFAHEQISHLDLEEKHVQTLLKLPKLKAGTDGWTEKVDLGPLFLNLTLDVATEFLYGRSANSQNPQNTDSTSEKDNGNIDIGFGYHYDAGKAWLYTRGLFGRWNRLIYPPQLAQHCRAVHKFVDGLVTKRLNQSEESRLSSQRFSVLDELVKNTQNPLELRNETLQLLNAGRDTTGATIGWVFYFLARHERVFNKLREGILHHFGHDGNGAISFQKLKSCEYLNHCIQETLRVAAVIPVNERVCINDTVLPRGGGPDGTQPIFVYKGLGIIMANYAMQYREDIWGSDVNEFRPERWQERKVGWDFLPFGAGTRKCLGEKFALTETAYVIVRFLQRFDGIENAEKPGPPIFQYVFSNRSRTGVQVRLHEAGN